MLIIQGKLIHESVIREQFMCNLNACKGACCWEGDFGAPLETAELYTLENIYEEIKPFLAKEGLEAIQKEGLFTYFKEAKEFGTSLINNGACAYMVYDKKGIAQCGIEQACNAGVIAFKKPVSCHLYPIRITHNEESGLDMLHYDEWDICSAACALGKQHKMPVYRFVREALVRKYGETFYEELEAAAKHMVGN